MFKALSNYADFNGRASRSEFWLYILLLCIVFPISYVLDFLLFGIGSYDEFGNPVPSLIITAVLYLAVIIPSISVQVRRLHDTNRSGWWWFIGLVPLVGFIVLLIYSVQPGDRQRNKFGPPPKETPGRIEEPRHHSTGDQRRGGFAESPPQASPSVYSGNPFSPEAPGAAPVKSGNADWLDKIEQLAKLKADGVLTEPEFAAAKAALLERRG